MKGLVKGLVKGLCLRERSVRRERRQRIGRSLIECEDRVSTGLNAFGVRRFDFLKSRRLFVLSSS